MTDKSAAPFAGIPIIDTLMDGLDIGNTNFDYLRHLLKGGHQDDAGQLPVEYMFKHAPRLPEGMDPVDFIVSEMDKHGIERAVIGIEKDGSVPDRAMKRFPTRFLGTTKINPNDGMEAVRKLEKEVRTKGSVGAFGFHAWVNPQVPLNDKKYYPIYSKCVELDIPIFLTVGVPGPRVPMDCQKVELLDEVCWFFPELKIVMRHGGEPWVDLAVKLMIKWPNLYYSTSAFAPRHWPREIIEYANTRGADKIIYAGYFPLGLSLDRIMTEMAQVPLKPHVWPKFLRDNAMHVLGLDR